MIETLRRIWHFAHPHHRRIGRKRRLEAILREHGISKALASQITNHYFRKANP